MKKWKITFMKQAEPDLGFFIENYPAIWDEIRRVMNLLAEEVDPRHPGNAELNVVMIEHDAPGWWRVYVGKSGPLWVRVIFRLLGTRKETEFEIEQRDKVDEFDEPKAIQIADVSFRKDAYGKRLRDRYKKR